MQSWRLIRTAPHSGAWNMAVDEALLETVAAGTSPPVLRLYRWRPAAVSLGYGQRGARQINLEACRRHGVDVVRRITGGRAVLHDRELTYAVVAPERGGVFPGGILDNYRVISGPLLALFSALGIDGRLVPGKTRGVSGSLGAGICFAAPSSYEILCDERKLTGGAQKRQDGAFLQHGSIPLDLDLELLWELLNPEGAADRAEGLAHLERTVGWVNRRHHPPLDIDSLETRFVQVFAECLGVHLVAAEPTDDEMRRAEELIRTRYAREDWTLHGR